MVECEALCQTCGYMMSGRGDGSRSSFVKILYVGCFNGSSARCCVTFMAIFAGFMIVCGYWRGDDTSVSKSRFLLFTVYT